MSTKTSRKPDKALAATFGEHVKELRTRLMVVALVFLVLSAVAYSFRDPLIALVRQPLGDQELVYLTPAGGFSFIFSVTMYAAMVVVAPFLMYQLYQFVKPALPQKVRKYSLQVSLASTMLMIAGVLFGYLFAVPAALKFLTTFAGDVVSPNLTADSYLNFFMAYVAGLAILFQLPLLLMFWNWINPLKPGQLLKSQRFVIAGAFIAAAMITPTPDALNQAMVALPIIVIYQLGVIGVYTTNRRKRRALQRHAIAKHRQQKAQQPATSPTPPRLRSKPTVQHAAVAQPMRKPHPQAMVAAMPSVRPVRRSIDGMGMATAPHRRPATLARPSTERVVRRIAPPPTRGSAGVHRSLDGVSFVR